MPESPKQFYSRNPEKQDNAYPREEMPQEFVQMRERFVEQVGKGKVLDAGCGPGMDTDYFSKQGRDATGVDLAEGMIEYARENKKGEFQIQDLRNLEFKDGLFDGIWCSAAMFFFPEVEMKQVLGELNRVLKEKGVLYVDFRLGDGPYMREKWGGSVRQYHIKSEKARKLLEKSGFEVSSSDIVKVHEKKQFNIFICSKTC